jgi:D-alanyl-lipoteichoic acid acyltransferase DltB (MBOAT superfamily)
LAFDSVAFAVYLACFLLSYQLLPTLGRKISILLFSVIFLGTFIDNYESLAALALVLASGYALAIYAQRVGRINITIVLYLCISLACFVVIQKYSWFGHILGDEIFNHSVSILGYSYIMFRQIHVIIDSAQGTIKNLSLFRYMTFILSFMTIVAGPIQRYQEFQQQWDEIDAYSFDVDRSLRAMNRLASGFMGVYAFAPLCLDLPRIGELWLGLTQTQQTILDFYTFPTYYFFNFAGYTSIMIGIGAFIGFKIPENFDKLYLSEDPLNIWSRWHLTLSYWLRDYVFTPLYKNGIAKFPNRAIALVVISYFLTFFIAGMWHDVSVRFFLLGLLYGTGAAVTKLLEELYRKQYGRKSYKALRQRPIVRAILIIITLHFFALSFQFL